MFSELGKFPLIISVIARCIKFWLHVVKSSDKSLSSKAYLEQFRCCCCFFLSFFYFFFGGGGARGKGGQICKTVLTELGFTDVWENQVSFHSLALISCIKNKLKERYLFFLQKII